jgi:hypothetical protein
MQQLRMAMATASRTIGKNNDLTYTKHGAENLTILKFYKVIVAIQKNLPNYGNPTKPKQQQL